MQILKQAGEFVILTPEIELRAQLLRIEKAGRTCYQSENKEITEESAKKFIRMLLTRKPKPHESVIEHSSMTVQFNNISRGFTHEMVRHRLCAFSQESTRYVDYAREGVGADLDKFELKCITPPHKDENARVPMLYPERFSEAIKERGDTMSIKSMFECIEIMYRSLRKAGWDPQDARQVLPIGLKSQLVVTANFREWRHIFSMRTTKPAHWEIRYVIGNLLEKIQEIVPAVFDDFIMDGVDKNGVRYFIQKES